jgi:hypothetical protein
MIDIRIHIKGNQVGDSYRKDKPTLDEVAVALFRLEQIKMRLLMFQSEDEFMVEEDGEGL